MSSPEKPNVWAVCEGVRIDPLTGRAFEENSEKLPGGIAGPYRSQSLIWDAAVATVSLKGAANEVLAFQLIIEGAGLTGIDVVAGPLAGPGGAEIPAENLGFFRAFYIHVDQHADAKHTPFPLEAGWYADPLVPLATPALGAPFAIDGSNFGGGAPTGVRNQTVWVDVWIPKGSPAGAYTGPVTVRSDSGEVALKLSVEVFGFEIPPENHTVLELMSYADFAKLDQHLREEMFRLAHAHRGNITNTQPTWGYTPELTHDGEKFNWEGFDRSWGPAIDGSLYTDGPRAHVPATHFNITFEPRVKRPDKGDGGFRGRGWPVMNQTTDDGMEVVFTPEYVAAYTRLLQDVDRHFAERYPETTVVVYQDSLDEPGFHHDSERAAMAQLRSIAGHVKIFKDAGLKRTRYKFDIGGGFARCKYDLDGDGQVKGAADVVNALLDVGLWNVHGLCINTRALAPAIERGAHVWFYNGFEPRVGPYVIGCEGLGPRTWPWVAFNSDVNGMCIWHFLFGADNKPWVTGGISPDGKGNNIAGTAMLMYQGRDVGLADRAFASMRLKMFRRGLQDYEYFHLLSEADGDRQRAKYFSTRVVRNSMNEELEMRDFQDDGIGEISTLKIEGDQRHWSHDPEDYERLRYRLGELLGGS